jgi:alpha-L-fucosidase
MKNPTIGSLWLALALGTAASAGGPVPSPRQAAWQELELTMFCHFGVNTFTDREWGDGREDPNLFQPEDLDCRQWARAAKAAGFRLIILTAKHHDGFCLWPSACTDHSVKSSSWRGGKGDVVKDLTDACRAEGLKAGIYLSPWDRHEASYGTDAYNEHFCNQLTELLTNYGRIDEVWFDGACGEGPNGKRQVYDWKRYYSVVRRLQPQAVIAICGPDVRWVGNESGVARVGESSVQTAREGVHFENTPGEPIWYPAECDVSIRPGWFCHASQDGQVKSLEHLLGIYFQSVGRNSSLLLNVPPDRRGLFADPDVKRLEEFGRAVKDLYANTVAEGKGAAEVQFGGEKSFNLVNVREDVKEGERVRKYRMEARSGGVWTTVARGTSVGTRNLHRLREITADAARLVVEKSEGEPLVLWSLHRAPVIGAWGTASLAAHKPASASNVHPNGTEFGGDKAVDDDPQTRWATSDDIRECWLEVDLLKAEALGRLAIAELQPRITKFQLEVRDGAAEDWKVAFEGGQAGTNFKASFAPVRARYARLQILEASAAPTIWEFELLPP